MYEIIDRHLPTTLGIRITGDFADDEFARFRGDLAAILDTIAKLNMVVECVEGVELRPASLWDDLKFVESRAGQFGRMALIATEDWAPVVEIFVESGFQARHFLHADTEAAWQWADEG